jgi:hypothetical protein
MSLLTVIIPNQVPLKSRNSKEYSKKYREKNRERLYLYKKAWVAKNKDKVKGYYEKEQQINPEVKRKRARRSYHKNRESILDRIRLRKYGIDGETFRTISKKQGNKCLVCNKAFNNNPNVDHSHRTGKIRGLLCSDCNCALGFAFDSPELLRRMADYLEEKDA